MGITVYPITPEFVAEAGDVDRSDPLPEADWEAIRQAFWKYAVLIFPGQDLTPEAHAAFAGRFGPIETDSVLDKQVNQMRVGSKFTDQSNLDESGQRWEADSRRRMDKMGNRLWHTDSSFKRTPGLCSLLYCDQPVPLGGHTEFADPRASRFDPDFAPHGHDAGTRSGPQCDPYSLGVRVRAMSACSDPAAPGQKGRTA